MGDFGPPVAVPETEVPSLAPSSLTDPDEVSVLVTGFGPFKTNIVNASYLIASSLPQSLELPSAEPSVSGPASRRISIHVHPSPIPVAYSTVRTAIPAILKDYAESHGGRRPDIVLHMGIAATRSYYSIETKAHRDSYHLSDIKGRIGYEDGEKVWREHQLPPVLQAGPATDPTDIVQKNLNPQPPNDDFLSAWKSFVSPGADVRISEDAGRYLCEFIFYTSLAQAFQQGQNRNVVFFHVPGSCADEDIERGTDIAAGLIKALVTSWVSGQV
ncbi:pyroglutamyl peptidase type I [Aspergillus bombycis]|uniref:Pyroglutamyl peptidase type I n=1 Tax=Aspergillus bombycis TaxID=109264 RepID=A0A1F8AGE5_9EURO|nr:pyroglutamyl peptidase type I [Aspergillus bombycis]OGM50479.1 pyroglutamyl peptidase type I [Aspergillus bombycis]